MSDVEIFEGKTTNEAIENGLKKLKVKKSDVEIKVIENEDKRSFFNILAPRVVKVEMKLKEKRENAEEKEQVKEKEVSPIDEKVLESTKKIVEEFLSKFLKQTINQEVEYKCYIENNVIKVQISDQKADFLIGYRGETLNAIQMILSAIVAKKVHEKVRVELDILDYREKRKKSLEELAEKIAKSVIRTRKSITLEPMTPYERKIIHMKLQNNSRVKTTSIGEGTHRKVVVSLK